MAKKVDNYVTFVALDPIMKNASASFSSFEDQDGNIRSITHSIDPRTGQEVQYRFKFNRDKRFITIPVNKKDMHGNSYVEFLRNHPLNANSPNPVKNPWYKELDNGKDAEIAIDSLKLRNKAENIALKLKTVEVEEISKVLGFTGDENIKLHKILQYATKNPSDFLSVVEDPNRKAIALFEACVKNKIITKHGFRFVYQDVHLGNDKEKAVVKIADDKDLQELLEKALKTAGA